MVSLFPYNLKENSKTNRHTDRTFESICTARASRGALCQRQSECARGAARARFGIERLRAPRCARTTRMRAARRAPSSTHPRVCDRAPATSFNSFSLIRAAGKLRCRGCTASERLAGCWRASRRLLPQRDISGRLSRALASKAISFSRDVRRGRRERPDQSSSTSGAGKTRHRRGAARVVGSGEHLGVAELRAQLICKVSTRKARRRGGAAAAVSPGPAGSCSEGLVLNPHARVEHCNQTQMCAPS